ncbi:hypothetical protein [Pseudoxanthomonas wuyuanensis]
MAIAGMLFMAAAGCLVVGLAFGAIGWRRPDPGRALAIIGLCGNGLGLLGIGLLRLIDVFGR